MKNKAEIIDQLKIMIDSTKIDENLRRVSRMTTHGQNTTQDQFIYMVVKLTELAAAMCAFGSGTDEWKGMVLHTFRDLLCDSVRASAFCVDFPECVNVKFPAARNDDEYSRDVCEIVTSSIEFLNEKGKKIAREVHNEKVKF